VNAAYKAALMNGQMAERKENEMWCIEIFVIVVFWIKFGHVYGLIALGCGLLDALFRYFEDYRAT